MPRRCVVFGCSGSACAEEGVSVHIIPFFGDKRPAAVTRRKMWIDFVNRTRKNWNDSRTSAVCSKHFNPEDFEQSLAVGDALPDLQSSFKRSLRRDELGICAYPTVYPPAPSGIDLDTRKSTKISHAQHLVSTALLLIIIPIVYFTQWWWK